MNRTIEDSKNFDIVCMSFGKEKERGIKVVKAGKKDCFKEATESKDLKTENSELYENNNLKEEEGNIIINFADYKQAKNNNDNRITQFAVEKAKREKRKQRDNEQVI